MDRGNVQRSPGSPTTIDAWASLENGGECYISSKEPELFITELLVDLGCHELEAMGGTRNIEPSDWNRALKVFATPHHLKRVPQ